MDDRDHVLDGNGESESRMMRVSEGVVDDETPIGNFDGQVGGGGGGVDGGCNGDDDDVMVEVYGSDVFVDGVCSSGSGSGENMEEDEELEAYRDGSVEEGSVREERFGDGGKETLSKEGDGVISAVDETGVDKYSEDVVAANEEPRMVLVGQVAALSNENSTDGQMVQNESLQHSESLDDEGSVLNDKINREAGSMDDETGKSGTEFGMASSTIVVEENLSVKPPVVEELNPDDEAPADALNGVTSCASNNPVSMAEKVTVSESIESSFQHTQIIGNETSEVHNKVTVESKNETFRYDNGNEGAVSLNSNLRFRIKVTSEQTVESIVHQDSEVRREAAPGNVNLASNRAQGPKVGEKVKSDTNCTNTSAISPLDANTNAVVSSNVEKESTNIQMHEVDVDEAKRMCNESLLDDPNTDALNKSFDENTNSEVEGECRKENYPNDASKEGDPVAVNSSFMDHQASGLAVPQGDDNQFVEAMDERYEVEYPHSEGGVVQGLVDTFGFPAPECLGNSITELGPDSEQEDLHAGETIEPEEKGVVAKLSKTIGEKRKATDSFDDDSSVLDRRKSLYNANHSNTVSANPRQSYKIGDCISRVASQLTGSPLTRKANPDCFQKVDVCNQRSAGSGYEDNSQAIEDSPKRKLSVPDENSTPDKMLPNLHLLAQDPMKEHIFLNTVLSFFSNFRNSVVPGQYSMRGSISADKVANGRKRKANHSLIGSPKTFEFEDMKDSYWTDRVIQNGSEEQPPRRNKREYHQSRTSQPVNHLQASHGLHTRKKTDNGSSSSHRSAGGRSITTIDTKKTDLTPTEVVMKFPQADSVPSAKELTIMFRHFGPLKESETEVDLETSRARVIFRRRLDAEVAFDSASTFNIWGQMPVSYQLKYSPSEPFKAPPVVPPQDLEAAIAQDMEMAATEYLEDATTQYLDDVSIQYLEDGTTHYMEDASVHYLEDGSIQYLEVSLPQHHEHDRSQNVVDASSHIVGVATTEHLEATTTRSLKSSPPKNPEIAEMQQNLEDAASQGQKSPNPGVEMQNVEGAAAPQIYDYETAENHEHVMACDVPELTTVHIQDETKVDTMEQGMEEEAAHALGDAEGTKVQTLEGSVPSHTDYETAQNLEVAMTHDLDDSKTEHMQDEKMLHTSNSDVKTPDTEGAASQATNDVEVAELQTVKVSAPQLLDFETSQSQETATGHYLNNSTTEMQDATVIQYTNGDDDVTAQGVEAAAAQAIGDGVEGEVQNVEVSGSQHSHETLQNLEAAASQAIDDVEEGEVSNVEVSAPQHSHVMSQNLEVPATHSLDISTTEEHYATAVQYTDDAAEHNIEDAMSHHLEVDIDFSDVDVTTQGVEEADLQPIDDEAEHHMEDVMPHRLEVDVECDD